MFLVQRVGVGTSYIAAARAVELLAGAGDIAAVRPTCALGYTRCIGGSLLGDTQTVQHSIALLLFLVAVDDAASAAAAPAAVLAA
jgi:hypothetical protein